MAAAWTITPMWEGQPCVILASGPSMNAAIAESVREAVAYRVIVINNTFRLAPWADMLYAADATWWKVHEKETVTFPGLKVTCSDVPQSDVLLLKEGPREGFADSPDTICTGGNSGYQAIHVAAHAGCKRILLCGFDMRGGHWHKKHERPLRDHGEGIYSKWIARFDTLVEPLKRRGIEVINCTPGSALKTWPFLPLEQALKQQREIAA